MLPLIRKKYYQSSLIFLFFLIVFFNYQWLKTAFQETFIYNPTGEWCPRCSPQAFSSNDLLNFSSKFLINKPNGCATSPFALILVNSAPKNIHKRNQIRNSYFPLARNRGFAVFFYLGYSTKLQDAVEDEDSEHHDIIQATFVDSWRNLTLKTISILSWFTNYCPSAKFLMKADDDAVINPSRLYNYLSSLPGTNILAGRLLTDHQPCFVWWKQRHCMPKSEHFKLNYIDYYPPYPAGPAYVLSKDSVELLIRRIFSSKELFIFFLEDVFITLLANEIGIKVIDEQNFNFCHSLSTRNYNYKVQNSIVVFDCSPTQFETIWGKFVH